MFRMLMVAWFGKSLLIGTVMVLVPLSLMAHPEKSDMNTRLLAALGVTFSNFDNAPEINIIGADSGRNMIYMRVVAVFKTPPQGLFNVRWLRRESTEIELKAINPVFCNMEKVKPPCYMVLHIDKRYEVKAPRGMWHEVSLEEYEKIAFSELYHLPRSGYFVHIDSDILRPSGQL